MVKNEKWYIYYIIFIFCIEFISYIISYAEVKSTVFLYPIYIAGEFFIVTGIFIKKLKLSKYSFIVTGLLGLFFLTADRIFLKYQYNNDYSKAVSNLIMICVIGYSLIQYIKNIKYQNTFQSIDKMYFFYFTVSIFIFLFQQQLLEFPIDYFSFFWIANNLMVCILYFLFIKTFLQLKK
ncbi:hypothetical protein D3C86_1264310 [compost metagenome]